MGLIARDGRPSITRRAPVHPLSITCIVLGAAVLASRAQAMVDVGGTHRPLRVVIEGSPGSGKTWAARALAHRLTRAHLRYRPPCAAPAGTSEADLAARRQQRGLVGSVDDDDYQEEDAHTVSAAMRGRNVRVDRGVVGNAARAKAAAARAAELAAEATMVQVTAAKAVAEAEAATEALLADDAGAFVVVRACVRVFCQSLAVRFSASRHAIVHVYMCMRRRKKMMMLRSARRGPNASSHLPAAGA